MTQYLVFFGLIFYCLPHFAQSKKLTCAPKPQAEASKSCPMKKDSTKAVADSAKDIKKVCEKNAMSDEFYQATKGFGVDYSHGLSDMTLEELKEGLAEIKKEISYIKKNMAQSKAPKNKAKVAFGKKIQKVIKAYEAAIDDPQKAAKADAYVNQYYKLIDEYEKKFSESFDYSSSDDQEMLKEYQEYQKDYETEIKKLTAAKGQKKVTETDNAEKQAFENKVAASLSHIKGRSTFTDCGLTDQELFAIMLYTGNHYVSINKALRNNDKEELARLKPIIDSINSGLKKIADHEGEVRRGAELPKEIQDKHCLDCEVVYAAYTSTSTNNGFGGNSRFRIQSKSGKYVAPLSSNASEEEVLFLPGTKFQVTEVSGSNWEKVFKMVEK